MTKIKDKLKEFDDKFVDTISGDMWQTTSREEIKNFIRQVLQETRLDSARLARNETIDEVIKEIEKNKFILDAKTPLGANFEYKIGYNQAIEDILTLLKDK